MSFKFKYFPELKHDVLELDAKELQNHSLKLVADKKSKCSEVVKDHTCKKLDPDQLNEQIREEAARDNKRSHLSPERLNQLSMLRRAIIELQVDFKKNHEWLAILKDQKKHANQEQRRHFDKKISDCKQSIQQAAVILTGALLSVDDEITSKPAYRFGLLSADRSFMHREIPKVIGVSDTNQLDANTKALAQKAWKDFSARRLAFLNEVKAGHPLKTASSTTDLMRVFELSEKNPKLYSKVMSEAHHHIEKEIKNFDLDSLYTTEVNLKMAPLVKTGLSHVVKTKEAEASKGEVASKNADSSFLGSYKNAINFLKTKENQEESVENDQAVPSLKR